MARVFDVPRYLNQSLNQFLTYSAGADGANHMAFTMGRFKMDMNSISAMWVAAGINPDEVSKAMDAAYDIGLRSNSNTFLATHIAMQGIAAELRRLSLTIVADDAAVFELFDLCINDELGVNPSWMGKWVELDRSAHQIATCGLVASFASPAGMQGKVSDLMGYPALVYQDVVLARCMAMSESWRMGIYSGKSRDHMKEVMCGLAEFNFEELILDKGGWCEGYPGVKVVVIAGLSIIMHGSKAYIIDSAARSQLADVLWSAGNTQLYAYTWRGKKMDAAAVAAGRDSVEYVRNVLRICRGRPDAARMIARHMKTAYAVKLADYGISGAPADEQVLARKQIRELVQACEAETRGFGSWHNVMNNWHEDLAIDFGTAWNLLPGIDADPAILDKSVEEKFTKPRVYSEDAWIDFMGYSRGVITAHLLHSRPTSDGTWMNVPEGTDPEAVPWVINCRAGNLDYPARTDMMWLKGSLPYVDHITNWFWGADDVTHVSSKIEKYESAQTMSELKPNDMNELLYALTFAPNLSEDISPSELRDAWNSSKVLGTNMVMLAAKNENTKTWDKKRETGSGTDTMREQLSEVDINFAILGNIIEGVAMRTGRRNLELRIGKIVMVKHEKVMLIALDVTGWSPNAPREKHMGFMDMLLDFFEHPEGMSVSGLTRDLKVLTSKRGYHRMWDSTDGTIQGWTGTGDTILHSLMAQWGFVRAREEGFFPKDAKIQKITLIDDILIRLLARGVKVEDAFHAIERHYLSLGYSPDAIKTLCSFKKGHFLNRLYANDFEVVTASKIWAKANRTYERSYAGVWSIVDSVFAGYLGAADRGACSYAAYSAAIWRSLTVLERSGLSVSSINFEYACVIAWMPRALGGHGLPIFTQWVTRESADALSSGIGAVSTLARVFRSSNPKLATSLMSRMYAFLDQPLEARSASATMDDPFSVRVQGLTDPETVGRTLAKGAASKAITARVFREFWDSSNSQEYHGLLHSFLMAEAWPAPLVAAIATTLPHAVAHSLTTRAEHSEAILIFAKFKARHEARSKLRTANRASVMWFTTIGESFVDPARLTTSGSDLALELRIRQCEVSGYRMSHLASVSSLDSVGLARDHGDIKLVIPAHTQDSIYTGIGKGIGNRTTTTRAMFEMSGPTSRVADPITEGIKNAMCVAAACVAMCVPSQVFVDLFTHAWIGSGWAIEFPAVGVTGTNPVRASKRMARRTYTLCMLPNGCGAVKVNAHSAISRFEDVHLGVDWLCIVYALRAAGLVEMEAGLANQAGETREYTLRSMVSLVMDQIKFDPDKKYVLSHYDGSISDHDGFCKRITDVLGVIEVSGEDEDDDGVLGIPARDYDLVFTAREVLKVINPTFAFSKVQSQPFIGATAPSLAYSSYTHADVHALNTPRIPAAENTRMSDIEKSVLRSILSAVAVYTSGFSDEDIIKSLQVARSKQHLGLLDVLRSWNVARVYKGISGVDANLVKLALDDIIRLMNSSGTEMKNGMVRYWLGGSERHSARAATDGLGHKIRIRSRILADVLAIWAVSYARPAIEVMDATIATVLRITFMECVMIRDRAAELARHHTKVIMTDWIVRMSVNMGFNKAVRDEAVSAVPASYVGKKHLIEGLLYALKDVWAWFVQDIVTAQANAERARFNAVDASSVDDVISIPNMFGAVTTGTMIHEEPEPDPFEGLSDKELRAALARMGCFEWEGRLQIESSIKDMLVEYFQGHLDDSKGTTDIVS